MKPRLALAGLVLAALAQAGCESIDLTSDDFRRESFQAYAATKVEGQTLEYFLESRTAVIISGAYALAAHPEGKGLTIYFRPGSMGDYGHAVAIESDGYFLTAGHCVSNTINYLIYYDGHGTKVVVPRVVARVFQPGTPLDYAILQVDAHLPGVFKWAPTNALLPGTTVFSVGSTKPQDLGPWERSYEAACLAGHITGLSTKNPAVRQIVSEMPMRKGDSGGPIVTADGRLAGINSRTATTKEQQSYHLSVCPDPKWVASIIQQDRLRPAASAPELLAPYPRDERAQVIDFSICLEPAGK